MAGNSQTYIVRPSPRSARPNAKHLLQVILPVSAFPQNNLRAGNICQIKTEDGKVGPVLVWPSAEKIQDSIIQVPKNLQDLYGLKLGDKVSILRDKVFVEDARSITLSEVSHPGIETSLPCLSENDRLHWAWILEYVLEKAEYLCPGIILENVEARGEKRCFKVLDINLSSTLLLYHVLPTSKIQILDVDTTAQTDSLPISFSLLGDQIGGMYKELKQINDILTAYGSENLSLKFPPYYRRVRGRILIHGASGTGKTMMLKEVSAASWRKVYPINTEKLHQRKCGGNAVIQDIFADARRNQPSLIAIDGIERIAGKQEVYGENAFNSMAPILCQELDQLESARVLVLATTTDLSKIDQSLRGLGRLEFEIEMPIPDSKARAEILKIKCGQMKNSKNELLESLAEYTHGFVGADLDRLIQVATDKAVSRVIAQDAKKNYSGSDDVSQAKPEINVDVLPADFEIALHEVRPTAMREIFLETPKVRWSDIGGQTEVKSLLEQSVKWPFKYSADMDRLGIEPKKGLLLYGPPGCSKTLIAKAVATESGLNFIAVKGGELLRMYVGESERALREVFTKARAASPSILFFDEIDAVGRSREGNFQSGESAILTTMLNELDGIESLRGVFVLAATNTPQILDPALLRPGRLDTILYVGLPELESRREILQIRLRSMDIDKNLDIGNLARRTEGYSGAEIVSICQKAGYAALEDQISTGLLQQVRQEHFHLAIQKVPRQVTREMIERYKAFEGRASNHQ